MKNFKPFYKGLTEKEHSQHEITVGNYTTKHFYMCGSAQTVMKKNANVKGAEELTRLQDDFYKLEKEVMDAGSATDEQKETARNMYNEIMKRAGEIGLADDIDDYMLQHIDSIEKGDPKPGFGRTDVNESLWANIHKKRERIKRGSGERMRKPGEKGAPTPAQLKRAKGESVDEKAPDTSDAMKRYKAGKAGFTDIAHLKAKGLIKRSDGTKRKSDKYK